MLGRQCVKLSLKKTLHFVLTIRKATKCLEIGCGGGIEIKTNCGGVAQRKVVESVWQG